MEINKDPESSEMPIEVKVMQATSKFKFSNLQKLNLIVNDLTKAQLTTISSEGGNQPVHGIQQKVLDRLKHRIKSSFQKLYENYDDNRTTIISKIHQVENNQTKETAAHFKLKKDVKDKGKYDRIKNQISRNNNKLKQVRDRTKLTIDENSSLESILQAKIFAMKELQNTIENLDYQTAILEGMRVERRKIQMKLKERHNKMLKEQEVRHEKAQKLQDGNYNKQAMLQRLHQDLHKEEQCQIPLTLAEELEKRIDQYENKLTYQTIAQHEGHLNQQRQQQTRRKEQLQRMCRQKLRQQKDKKQQEQIELAYNMYLIKKGQQQKLKKISGVSNLTEVIPGSLEVDYQNLAHIESQMLEDIAQNKRQNQTIRQEIDQMLTQQSKSQNQDLHHLEQYLQHIESTSRKVIRQSNHKSQLMEEWQGVIQMMCDNNCRSSGLGQSLQQIVEHVPMGKPKPFQYHPR